MDFQPPAKLELFPNPKMSEHPPSADTSPKIEEGVTKYQLDFKSSHPPEQRALSTLESWRQVLFRAGLIGIDPDRYDGQAYGNVSLRVGMEHFAISGTQTGSRATLTNRDYSLVTAVDLKYNRLQAQGLTAPSSEAMTHAALYQSDVTIACALHVHSPEIWTAATRGLIQLPVTSPGHLYGTPEMAMAIQHVAETDPGKPICMGGHQDGVMAYGHSVAEAGKLILSTLADAIAALSSQSFFTD
jgi:hypothetical protein